MFHFLSSIKELGLTTFLIAEQPFGSTRLAQWGEDFLADGILNLRQVEVGETDVQLRLRCIKMPWVNHDHNALALNHDGQKFFVTPVISKTNCEGQAGAIPSEQYALPVTQRVR